MLLSARPYRDMGAPPLSVPLQTARHFPQWSRTAILTLSSLDDDSIQEVKKSPLEPAGSGFIVSGDPVAKIAHLEHSVRFLQEQHRLMLNGLHVEIEALRERNRDLQFQLIFNKESKEPPPKPTSPTIEENVKNSEEEKLKSEVSRLEKEAAALRSEAQAADAHVMQLRQLVKVQAEKIRDLETIVPQCVTCEENAAGSTAVRDDSAESRAELRARLADAEKLVRRLRAEADRRHRELQCMKNSLHASLRATGLDAYGFQNNYHFPPVHHTPDFWREPTRDDLNASRGRCSRRNMLLPELSGQQVHRSTIYANNHTSKPRTNGFDNKNRKPQPPTNELTNGKIPEQEQPESGISQNHTNFLPKIKRCNMDPNVTYPELKIVVTKMIPHGNVSSPAARVRPRRPHRKPNHEHT